MASGSGAYVLHAELAGRMSGYRLQPFSPWWTLFPPAMKAFADPCADLIHTGADYGLFLRRRGVPQVLTLHNYVCDSFMRPYSSPLQYLHYRTDLRVFLRRSLHCAEAVVAVSRYVMDRVRDDLEIARPVRLIYNGVDEQRFVPGGKPRRRGPLRVFFCGNLNRRKQPQLLIPLANALGEGFEIHYTAGLAGAGVLHGEPDAHAATLKNLGSIRHADMPEIYRSMDVLFMPSVREGFGLCVAEAMACGLPVVAADSSALPELVENGQGGYLCPPGDLQCYVRALEDIAESSTQARQMGEYNRTRVEERFTLSRMVNEYRMLFEEVMATLG